MKANLKAFISKLKPVFESVVQHECSLSLKWAAAAHKLLLSVQWGLPPGPEHFDHSIDLFYQWLESRNHLWLERGLFGILALKGGRVL